MTLFKSKSNSGILAIIGLVCLSVLAGNAHEAINVGVGGALLIYAYKNRKTMTARQWAMMLSFGIGLLFLIFTPAAFKRFVIVSDEINYCYNSALSVFHYRMLYVLIAYLLYLRITKHISFKQIYKENEFCFNVIVLSLLFNYAVGMQFGRQIIGAEMMSIIVVLQCSRKYGMSTKFANVWIMCFAVVFALQTWLSVRAINYTRNLYDRICIEYKNSEDGIIYSDYKHDEYYSNSVPLMRCASYLIEQDLVTEFLQRELQRKYPGKKPMQILPTCMKNPGDLQKGNYYIRNAEGNWCVVLDKSHKPKDVRVKRVFDIAGFILPNWDKVLDMETDKIYENDSIIVLQTMVKTSFVVHKDIAFDY